MQSSRRKLTRPPFLAALALSLVTAACSIDGRIYTGFDAEVPPGAALLTVTLNGTASGTVSSSPGGIACDSSCSAVYPSGTVVTLTATPAPDAQFGGWSGGGCTGAAPTCTVTIDDTTAVTATFDVAEYPVTIELGGSGSGMVVAPAAGINCPGTCTVMVQHGGQLSLAASTSLNSQFMGWTVGPGGTACSGTGICATTITGPTKITATFALYQSLEVVKSGNGNGTVTSDPTGISCGDDCSETYLPGTSVALSATAGGDSIFKGWSGGGCSDANPCSVVVNGATMVTADFELRKYILTVTKAGAGAGTVISTPAGIDCDPTCTGTYDAGTVVTLTASPAAGSLFAGWSGGGCTGPDTCMVTMNASTSVTALFAPILHTLTVAKTGSGAGTVTSSPAGIACGGDCTEDFAQGATVTLTATPNTGSTFTGWSGGGCSGPGTCTVMMAAATTVTAAFAPVQYTLTAVKAGTGAGTVTSSPAGINCGSDCSEPYVVGTGVTLTAAPSTGSTFTGWSGGGCIGTGTCMVTMDAAKTVTATFTLKKYTLTVNKTGTGTVTSTPTGINCGTTCSKDYDHGTMVALTATPATGWSFSSWGGACSGTTCNLTMDAAKSVTATFTLNTYTLSVNKTGSGTVTSSPTGINCGSDCSEVYDHGTAVTLTATPAAGWTFSSWGGACSGSTPTCSATMDAAKSVTATFTLNKYTLTVNKTGTGTVTSTPTGINCGTTCSKDYDHGTTVTLTATPATGWSFSNWGGACSGTTCNVTMDAE